MDESQKNTWNSILDNLHLSKDKKDWMTEYAQTMQNGVLTTPNDSIISENTGHTSFPSLLPMAIKISAKTIGFGGFYESDERIQRRKRILKLKRLLGDIEFKDIVSKEEFDDILTEKKDCYEPGLVSVQPMSAPLGMLMYVDYKYVSKSESIREKRRKKIERILEDDSEEDL